MTDEQTTQTPAEFSADQPLTPPPLPTEAPTTAAGLATAPSPVEITPQSSEPASAAEPVAPKVTIFRPRGPRRPHVDLCEAFEAEDVARDLVDTGVVTSAIHIHEADHGAGLPPANGDWLPLLITFTDVDPVSVLPVAFHCNAAEIVAAFAKHPQGAWVKDFDARTLRRVGV